MTLKYIGNRRMSKGKRIAEFSYYDNEYERFRKIVDYLETMGYEVDAGVENWAAIEVEDEAEFRMVMHDWKNAKKLIRK